MQKSALYKASILFAVIGLIVSAYLTVIHYYGLQPACPETGIINCENVLTSQFSTMTLLNYSIPVPILGLVFFIAELLAIIVIKNNDAFIFLSGIGVAFVVYLLYVEYVVGNICIYCTAVHICTASLFLISIFQSKK